MEIIRDTAIGLGQILLACLAGGILFVVTFPLNKLQEKCEAKYPWMRKVSFIVGLTVFITWILVFSYGIGSGKIK